MRAITAAILKNDDLFIRCLNEEVSPDQLAVMSSEDMASEKLKQEMAESREKSEKQSTLVQEANGRPHVRRTHKGEEYIEDPNAGAASEALPPPPVPRRDSEMLPPHSPTVGQQDTIMTEDTGPPSATLDRRTSSNFDIKNVWQSVPNAERTSSGYTPHSAQQDRAVEPKLEPDTGIDRMLEDDDNESAPYSPNEYEGPPVAWTGHVDMPNIGKFRALAQHVAGADLAQRMTVADIFPNSLTMSGRIHGQKADEYLSTLGSARNTDVVVFNILPNESAESTEARKQFVKLWDYFVKRDRWGVVSDQMHREHVTDTYVVPLEKGMGESPVFLQRLSHNIIEAPRPRDMLLAVFVCKWRGHQSSQPPPINAQASVLSPGMSHQPMANSTPIGPAGNVMSPIATPASAQPPAQGFPPPSHQSNSLPHHGQAQAHSIPEYPYGAPAPVANGSSAAQSILGEYYNCPTAKSILGAQQDGPVAESILKNLRDVFEKYPEARDDMAYFNNVVQRGQEQG